jgi:hypothetical protein
MSARTIIAAPVIWFGSWLLSVIAYSWLAPAALSQRGFVSFSFGK